MQNLIYIIMSCGVVRLADKKYIRQLCANILNGVVAYAAAQ